LLLRAASGGKAEHEIEHGLAIFTRLKLETAKKIVRFHRNRV
jgi:hypothetical protein